MTDVAFLQRTVSDGWQPLVCRAEPPEYSVQNEDGINLLI